jgi:hypothetical protein
MQSHDVGKMRKRAVAALLAHLCCLDSTAADTPYVYPFNMMTGAELVQKLTTEPASPGDARESDRAHYYLAGIKDGTQGSVWCFRRAMLPDELNYEIAHALKARHKAEELNANAAPLVLAELRRRYPCRNGTGGDQ